MDLDDLPSNRVLALYETSISLRSDPGSEYLDDLSVSLTGSFDFRGDIHQTQRSN